MLKRLRAALHMALALRFYRRRENAKARHHVDRFMEISPRVDAVAIAFDATLLILELDSLGAAERFKQALSEANSLPEPDSKYVTAYCRYYAALINRDPDYKKHRLAGLSANASDRVRRCLYFPPAEIRIPVIPVTVP